MNICIAIDEHLCFPWFSCVFMQNKSKDLKKNIIFVFHALYSINYVKSVGFTNLFLLQYRVPPELTEFKKRQIVSLISYKVQYYLSRESLVKFQFWIFRREGKIVYQFDLYHFWIPAGKKISTRDDVICQPLNPVHACVLAIRSF